MIDDWKIYQEEVRFTLCEAAALWLDVPLDSKSPKLQVMQKVLNSKLVEFSKDYFKKYGNSDEEIYALLLEEINHSRILVQKSSHYSHKDSLEAASGKPRNAMPREKRGIDDSDEKYRFEFISRGQLTAIAKLRGERPKFLFAPDNEKTSSSNKWGEPNNKGSYHELIEVLYFASNIDFIVVKPFLSDASK
jgi:hypothetical protein